MKITQTFIKRSKKQLQWWLFSTLTLNKKIISSCIFNKFLQKWPWPTCFWGNEETLFINKCYLNDNCLEIPLNMKGILILADSLLKIIEFRKFLLRLSNFKPWNKFYTRFYRQKSVDLFYKHLKNIYKHIIICILW